MSLRKDSSPGVVQLPSAEPVQLEPARINWVHMILLSSTPILAVIGLFAVTMQWKTMVLATILWIMFGMSITTGFHRLFSHCAYTAPPAVQFILLVTGAGALQGSCLWWSRNHRVHHRYNDTELDPYGVHRGFWWAHIGWMLWKQDPRQFGVADVSDLKRNRLVMWQHRNYPWLALTMAFVLPTVVAGVFWGDWWGGFFFASVLRTVFVHHTTFCVNSLAHYIGDRTFNDKQSAVDSWVTALVTFGEGYHNFHHQFASDYRNAIEWWQYDPTKWLIRAMEKIGLATGLRSTPRSLIELARTKTKNHAAVFDEMSLPVMTSAQLAKRVAAGEMLLVVEGVVVDAAPFVNDHPGGRAVLTKYVGQEIAPLFIKPTAPTARNYDAAYAQKWAHSHSIFAYSLLLPLRIARLEGPACQ